MQANATERLVLEQRTNVKTRCIHCAILSRGLTIIETPAVAWSALPAMSDDEADPELLELLRQSLGISNVRQDGVSSDTGR